MKKIGWVWERAGIMEKAIVPLLLLLLVSILLFGGTALATTWVPSEMTDPLTGEQVPAQGIMSWGSYIYHWPSKYDLVFWPLTDENWICLNPNNGYAAFNNDFEQLPDEEKEALSSWLADHYQPTQPPETHREKLAWLEQVYGQRSMSDDFWCQFYRLMAYVYRGDRQTSIAYVKKSLPLLEKKLQQEPEGIERLEVLYLLGEYHRRLGDGIRANEYFRQVKDVPYRDEDGSVKVGHPYFLELVQDRRNLMDIDG